MAPDKLKHFGVCFAIALAGGALASWWFGFTLAMLAGIGKEARDSMPGGTGWDWRDLGADLLGAAAGTVLILCIK